MLPCLSLYFIVALLPCDYNICFRVVSFTTLSVSMLCLKDPLMEYDAIHPELLLTVGVVCWSKLAWCWRLKDKKNAPSTINYYLLEPNGESIYSIYLQRETVTFIVFEVFGWCSFSIIQFFGERGFCWRGISSWRYFFYSVVFGIDIGSLLSFNPKNNNFIEDSLWNKHSPLANQSQIISYTFSTFWLVSQSHALIYVSGRISLPLIRL